jgi:hypothetical protein
MSGWLRFSLVSALILALCVQSAFAANPEKKSRMSNTSEEVVRDIPISSPHRVPSQVTFKYGIGQKSYQNSCDDISPEAGTIIQHDQIGTTTFEWQQNGSMGRMISVTPDGYRHFSWTFSDVLGYPYTNRWVDANCKSPAGTYLGQVHADGGAQRAGFPNQSHLFAEEQAGISVITHHRIGGTPVWFTTLTMGDAVCDSSFGRHWDIPDSIAGSEAEYNGHGYWPKADVQKFTNTQDYIHIAMMDAGQLYPSDPSLLAYERCHLGSGDTLICRAVTEGMCWYYRVPPNETFSPPSGCPVGHFDTTCGFDPAIVASQSSRVAIAFLKPACISEYCDYFSDVCYIESMNYGDDWVDGSNWPPEEHNLTNFGCGGTERALYDINACYDFDDSLHLVWVTAGFDEASPGYFFPGVARLYHWSKKTGIVMITSPIWEETQPPAFNANIAKASISAMDPIHHGPDSVFLYCIWSQFDTNDNAANGHTNADIYGASSYDGGATWGPAYNLTNTKTPDCTPGECLSEHWGSLALNLHEGSLHIQYICDRDAGAAIYDEGEYTENPVMYLELEAWRPEASIMCGDANGNEAIEAGDVVHLITYLFRAGPEPIPLCIGDANCSSMVEAGDIVYLIGYLFRGGDPPCPDCCP